MAREELAVQLRDVVGKQVGALRREGLVPGVVYGPELADTVQVAVDRRTFERFYQRNGHSTLVNLVWDGGSSAVFIRTVQRDPVRQSMLHVEYYAPNLRKDTRALVPVVLHNPDVHADGILTELVTEIELEGRPEKLPHQVNVDISGLLNVGDTVRIADITLPEGLIATADPETVIAQLVAATVEPVEEEVVEETPAAEIEEATEAAE